MTKKSRKPTLASLMKRKLNTRSVQKAMELIAHIIDMGSDEKSAPALDHANLLIDQLLKRKVHDKFICQAHYFRANIWSAKRRMSPDWQSWVWKSKAVDGEIYELRSAIRHTGFVQLYSIVQVQIYTNLGNILNNIGRFIEAIEYWDRALSLVPKFAMASGNRGLGLIDYAGALYDPGHRAVLSLFAGKSLSTACESDAIYDNSNNLAAANYFTNRHIAIWDYYDIPEIERTLNLENHSLGRGKDERNYRNWCLNERLFINPLNDVGSYPIAAHDVMTLPAITVGIDDGPGPPYVIHHFNIIKQEFCTARFAFYEGLKSEGVHYSDRGVLLLNTLDYPAFGFGVERMKMAFRGAYAVFDKIAFLINAYFGLGHSETQVNFNNLWFVKGRGKKLHPLLDGMANWPLRGLFWLSKDIYDEDFRDITEPDAQFLSKLRNHLEHKFVSVHDSFFDSISSRLTDTSKVGVFDISSDELISKTLRQLKLARAAIIYLSLAIHAEESRREQEKDETSLAMPMFIDTWEDSWKRRN